MDKSLVTIYYPGKDTGRLHYAASHLFERVLGGKVEILCDAETFGLRQGICINYSEEDLNHGIRIIPEGLLEERGIAQREMNCQNWRGSITLFHQGKGDVPFDVFSATFYLLTLYEEYLPSEPDEHGRFSHTNSFLLQKGYLRKPVVDYWAYALKSFFEERGYDTSGFALRKFSFVSTFDIDHPYLYWNKGIIRTIGGAAHDFLSGRFGQVGRRIAVNLKLKQDPYFTALQDIEKIHRSLDMPYFLFILMGEKTRYDRYTSVKPGRYYHYLKKLQGAEIGLHPSYDTLSNLPLMEKEKKELEKELGESVTLSRQHFLRLRVPDTFNNLLKVGIREDFSLTFAHQPGFRSGTSIPYPYYNFGEEKPTELLLRPTAFMDSTLIFHLKNNPGQALQIIRELIDTCREVGGDYVSLWHNSNIAGSENRLWKDVLMESLRYGISMENT